MTFKTLALSCAGVMAISTGVSPAGAADATKTDTTVKEVVITARRLDQARDTIQPQIGASTYVVNAKAIEAMPGGDNTQLNQVVLQAPGVAQDSYGQLHIRGEHNGVQYRLNGVILPEGLSVFGQALSPRLADRVTLITGALPAQYGLRTAGIIDITTKSGVQQGGSVSIYGGSHGEFEPSFEYAGHVGDTNMFVSGSFLTDQLGVESPDGRSTPLHDRTDQAQGFAYFDRVINPQSRVSLVVGTSNERFQIPDLTGQTPQFTVNGASTFPSAGLNENQKEVTDYMALSYLYSTEKFTGQMSLFGRYSSLTFTPDNLGDLFFDGIAQTATKTDVAGGVQAEGVYTLSDTHTLRGGVIVEVDRSTSKTASLVLPTDATGAELAPPNDVPFVIDDNGDEDAGTYSVYLQDEWKLLGNLTLNYGLRFDAYTAFRSENQLSPRVNLVWLPAPATTFHAGYARYFSPPPFELVGGETVERFKATTAAAPTDQDITPYAERADYFDVGVEQKVSRAFTVGLDTYYKASKHLIDEGQFGAPIILTPFNYEDGRQYGVELTTSYTLGAFTAYANGAYAKAQGRKIVSSQFNFDPAELAYIADHYIYLDHDQTYSASVGVSYLWRGTRVSSDLIYGSGLRANLTLPGGQSIPNGAALGPYTTVNLSASHKFETLPGGPYEVRLDVINAFDANYQIRNGTGVGVGAPQFGARRGVFVGLTKSFG